ncbi:uncharacterized protein LOC129618489 [Condylostylus longicornis]|uniref:uncharacterized protein LOC129618489 n=1 Tax=Condylostylus longicornis TaxID=2530218 RepID=UPI00244DEFC4|nr:uncharacterized protein LOC129618489 [Condylostylus longicornis]
MPTGKIEKVCGEEAAHDGEITCVFFESNNGLLFSGGEDGKIKIFDKDLKLKKLLNHHDSYICTLVVSPKGKLYSVSYDGCFKIMENPHKSNYSKDFLHATFHVSCMYLTGERLAVGDDSGVIKIFNKDQLQYQLRPVTNVLSCAIENEMVYAVRDEIVVTQIVPGKPVKINELCVKEGTKPLCLAGPKLADKNCTSFLIYCTKDGLGLVCVNNHSEFDEVWKLENVHTDEICAMFPTEKYLFTGAKDGFIKMWGTLTTKATLLAEINVGAGVNFLCNGPGINVLYAGCADGYVRRVAFA